MPQVLCIYDQLEHRRVSTIRTDEGAYRYSTATSGKLRPDSWSHDNSLQRLSIVRVVGMDALEFWRDWQEFIYSVVPNGFESLARLWREDLPIDISNTGPSAARPQRHTTPIAVDFPDGSI